jgi:hypothetical protein
MPKANPQREAEGSRATPEKQKTRAVAGAGFSRP